MEYCQSGDLNTLIKRHQKDKSHFTENEILNWFLQIAAGLKFVHKRKILHRDLKS